jgi:hypothetical protein
VADREPWPKPLDAPSLGVDPVAHLARRRPADPTLAPMITVRVQGGNRDGDEVLLPLRDVEAVLERARRYRASQWTAFETFDLVLRDILVHVNASPLVMRMPGGWIEVGKIADPWAGPHWLRVTWQEMTNRVQVETPPRWKCQ